MLYEAILWQLMASFENISGASTREKPSTQSPGASHLKSKAYWSLVFNVLFSWSLGFKPVGWWPENYISTGVLEPYKNIQNLAHFEQFS